jgi:hypothetical protein
VRRTYTVLAKLFRLTCSLANHLKFADNIITIDDKGIVEQRETPDAIDLEIETPSTTAEKSTIISSQACSVSPVDKEASDEFIKDLDILEDPQADANRRAGDLTIYTYFAKIAGWPLVCIYLVACASYLFGLTFPCKCQGMPAITSHTNYESCMAPVVGQGERNSS